MTQYLVTAVDNPHGTIFVGVHQASNPENAVQRAREDHRPESYAQELAISKDEKFNVYEINEVTTIET